MSEPSSPETAAQDGASSQDPPESIAGTVAGGLKWKLASQLLREGTRLLVAVILARILTPEDWGLAAMALVVSAFLGMIPDTMTIGLIQRTHITEKDRSTIFWTAMAIGGLLTILGIASSGVIAGYYDQPDVQPLFAALSLGFTISAAACVPETLLMRSLNYRALELRQMAGIVVGAVTAITLAVAGAGPWAIIGNSLAALSTSCVLLWWFTTWRPQLLFSPQSLRDLGPDGVRVLGTRVLEYIQMGADKILIGRYLGPTALGTYQIGFQLMFTPIGNIAYPLQFVLFPVFATIQDDRERLNAAWLRAKRLSVAVMAPAFLTLLVVAPDFIVTLLGPKWEGSVPIVQLLAIAGIAYSFNTQNWSLLVVRERTGVLLALTGLTTVTVLAGVAIGVTLSATWVAAMVAVAYWVLFIPELWIATHWGLVPFGAALRATVSPLPFAAAAAIAAYGVRLLLVDLDVPPAARVVLTGAFLVSLYVALACLGSRPLRREAMEGIAYLRRRRDEHRGRIV